MSRNWVVNASPLIVLCKIDRQGLLETLPDELVIPDAVATEINAGAETDATRKWISHLGARYITPVGPVDPIIAGWDLGAGENAVLTFARQHTTFEALVDDRAARNCAMTLQIPIRGTLGIILLAKRANLISEVRTVIEELLQIGLRIDQTTVQTILKLSDEE